MRKIEEQMVQAVFSGRNFKKSNTRVKVENDYSYVYLHNNLIAMVHRPSRMMWISNCGWFTATTKSRLNALGAGIKQRDLVWYVDGVTIGSAVVCLDRNRKYLYASNMFPDARSSAEILRAKIEKEKNSDVAILKRRNRQMYKSSTMYTNPIFS